MFINWVCFGFVCRLRDVCGLHAARVALLERHSARLHDDMRRLTKDLEAKSLSLTKLVTLS